MFPHHYNEFRELSSGLSIFLGAFLGAFFASMFGFITYVITKRRERFVQHKNALVKLERILNKHLDDLSMIQSIATDIKRVIDEHKMTNNRLFGLQLPENIDMDLGSVSLTNDLFAYRASIERLQIDVASVNHTLTWFEDLLISGQSVPKENFDFLKSGLQSFIAYLPQFDVQAIDFLVFIRIYLKKLKGRNSFVYGVINTQWEQNISEEEIKQEHEKLAQEIKLVQEKSKENISQL